MSDLGPEARAILSAGRDGDDPSPEDRARLKRKLLAGLAAGAATTAGAAEAAGAAKSIAAAKATTALAWSSTVWKAIAGIVVIGAVSGGIVVAGAEKGKPPRLAMPVITQSIADRKPPLAAAPADAAPEETKREEPKAEPQAKRIAGNTAPSAKTKEEDADTLLEETRQLREARRALKDGDADRALALLDDKTAANQGEKLGEERAAARVLALCKLGRVEEANAEAAKFLEKNPRSPLAARVRKACPTTP